MPDFRNEKSNADPGMENNPNHDKIKRRHLFILNPRSFRSAIDGTRRMSAEIRECFQARGLPEEDCQIQISRYPRDAIGIIQKYISDIPPEEVLRVYAVGGDGILFDCLNGIAGMPNTELASVPYGSSNDFVRAFGDDARPCFRDLAMQMAGGTIKTDIICGGNSYAMNFCTIGSDSASVIYTGQLNKTFAWLIRLFRSLTPLMFMLGGLMGIRDEQVRTQQYKITLDGEDFSGNYSNINIANGPCYGGDKSAVSTAMPDDGILDILLIKSGPFWQSLRGISDYVQGRYYKHPSQVIYKQARKIVISSGSPLLINFDGEMFFDTNITIELIPQAINFVAVKGMRYKRRATDHEQAAP